MINKELIKYSLKHIVHRKARSFLTIFSIFVGIVTIFIFVSFGQGLFDYVNDLQSSSGADKIRIIPKGIGAPGLDTTFSLTEDDIESIEKTAGVYEATGMYSRAAEVVKGRTKRFVFLVTYNPDDSGLIKEVFTIDIDSGRDLRNGDDGKVLLGHNYKVENKIFLEALTLNDNIEVQGQRLKIIGFFDEVGNPQDDSNIYITNNYFEKLYPGSSGKYNQIIARVDARNIPQIIDRIEDNLRKSRGLDEGKEDFFVASFEELLEQITSALDYIVYFVLFIALISVLVSAVNTANTTITSVLERIKEIGVMKAIGAKNSEVFAIFVFESGFLGFVAGVLGIIFGFLITYATGAFLDASGWGFLSPHYSLELFLGCILFAALTGAVSGIIPAWRSSKIRPVRALRYE
ncbi:ABC transporter permease [Candidatus Pacearchaeota archaeon]|nr:ABC transporter permease [Candidatus Pacearchaeota archaeon]